MLETGLVANCYQVIAAYACVDPSPKTCMETNASESRCMLSGLPTVCRAPEGCRDQGAGPHSPNPTP